MKKTISIFCLIGLFFLSGLSFAAQYRIYHNLNTSIPVKDQGYPDDGDSEQEPDQPSFSRTYYLFGGGRQSGILTVSVNGSVNEMTISYSGSGAGGRSFYLDISGGWKMILDSGTLPLTIPYVNGTSMSTSVAGRSGIFCLDATTDSCVGSVSF